MQRKITVYDGSSPTVPDQNIDQNIHRNPSLIKDIVALRTQAEWSAAGECPLEEGSKWNARFSVL